MIHNLPSTDSLLYQSVLIFNELSEEDNGTYQCTVSVRSTTEYPYVLPADIVSKNVSVNVKSKEALYTCDVMFISFVIGMTINVTESLPDADTLCSSSDPYHNVTLNCTASKPATVLSDFILTWSHNNAPIRSGLVTISTSKIMDNITYTTNILKLFNTYNNDSGVYTCRATLHLPDEPITLSKSYTLKGKKGHYLYE